MKNKNRVRKGHKNYQEFTEERGGYDPESLEALWDSESPFAGKAMGEVFEDAYEKLEELYYSGALRGRQREIVALLFDGVFNQTEIAERLGIEQREVAVHLQRLRKKL